jgi:hypothetical protein
MKKTTAYLLAILCSTLLAAYGCRQPSKPIAPPVSTAPQHTFSQNGSVREMNIWPENMEFPEREGKAEFVSYCGICHSLKYITAQPAFSRTTWEAEVHKMTEKYGAPIDSAISHKIVDYLVAINGE